MTPAIDNKINNNDIYESSDAFDTIEWLLKNTRNNGKVGIWGISYPGFYASASLPNAHPALKAVSPQAPVTDEFVGDDCNHNGAFFLLDNFDFYNYFDGQRNADSTKYEQVFSLDVHNAYNFFLDLGSLKNTNGPKYYDQKGEIWSQVVTHDTYDSFWRARNIRPHLTNIKPAVLVVGGWFDAEDMFGALRTYEAIEKQSPGNENRLVMGPWTHGAWSATSWIKFGTYEFGNNLNDYYKEIESNFFNFYLKGKGSFNLPEATVFETGSNQWKQYGSWPPVNAKNSYFYFKKDGKLSIEPSKANYEFTEYISDPSKPVPYTRVVLGDNTNTWWRTSTRFPTP
jgi:putative CocE/NonD family hydrolase